MESTGEELDPVKELGPAASAPAIVAVAELTSPLAEMFPVTDWFPTKVFAPRPAKAAQVSGSPGFPYSVPTTATQEFYRVQVSP